jgi:hypothetical protein
LTTIPSVLASSNCHIRTYLFWTLQCGSLGLQKLFAVVVVVVVVVVAVQLFKKVDCQKFDMHIIRGHP